jgi:hypothetical protein
MEKDDLMNIRDLADFHMKWLDFRPQALEIAKDRYLAVQQRELVLWLVHLADRVGEKDLSQEGEKSPTFDDLQSNSPPKSPLV